MLDFQARIQQSLRGNEQHISTNYLTLMKEHYAQTMQYQALLKQNELLRSGFEFMYKFSNQGNVQAKNEEGMRELSKLITTVYA